MVTQSKIIRIDCEDNLKFINICDARGISQNEYMNQLIKQEIARLNPNEELKHIETQLLDLTARKAIVQEQVIEYNKEQAKKQQYKQNKLKEVIGLLKPIVAKGDYSQPLNYWADQYNINSDELLQLVKDSIDR